MNTTIYLPMPEWQALSFLRNREAAFERLLTPAGNHHKCEVVLVDDSLFGFKNRADAVAVGHRVYPHGFAMVRINVVGKVLSGLLNFQRVITTVSDESGAQLYRVNRDGLRQIAEKFDSGEAEILVDQIFGGKDEHIDRCVVVPEEKPDFGLLEEGGGLPAVNLKMCGPTGFGC